MLDEHKRLISEVGRLADSPRPQAEGHVAERPELLPNALRVWAPCGCCWTYLAPNASVLTQCEAEVHSFSWEEAQAVLGEFLREPAELPASLPVVVEENKGGEPS